MTANDIYITAVPLVTLIVGAVVGFLSSYAIESKRNSYQITGKLIDLYLGIRQDLCDPIAELIGLRMDVLHDAERIAIKLEEISRLFYRYYTIAPREVLDQILCLYACLRDGQNRLWVIRDKRLCLADPGEISAILEDISVVRNTGFYAASMLAESNPDTRRTASINIQARKALKTISDDLSLSSLRQWASDVRR